VKRIDTNIEGCFIIEPQVFEDDRGSFFESYNKMRFEKLLGKKIDFVQDNQSVSKKGVLRGLHFQEGNFAQSKLIRVIKGKVLDVIVDIRENSETFGKHFKLELSEFNQKMLFIPKGMAHGFVSLSDETIFAYKCDEYYHQASENGIIYNDTTLKIDWNLPESEILLAKKDKELPTFKALFS